MLSLDSFIRKNEIAHNEDYFDALAYYNENPQIRVAEICCGAGGSGRGLLRGNKNADIVGFDIMDQPLYPFKFMKMNALKLRPMDLACFDLVLFYPPCQKFSTGTSEARAKGMEYPDLVDPFRKLGLASKRPFVIENVPNAPIRKDLLLCGTMFEDFGDSINVFRHRVFEIHGFSARQPGHTNHQVMGVKGVNSGGKVECVYGQKGPKGKNGRERWMKAMSLDKYDNFYLPYKDERGMMEHGISSLWSLKEAIPPQYTCYIMKEFVRCWNNGKTRLVH